MEVILIRHAESMGNKYKAQGFALLNNWETPLTAHGVSQAEEMSKVLNAYLTSCERDKSNTLLISSPFLRTLKTAEIIQRICGLKQVQIETQFVDWDFGQCLERSEEENQALYPNEWEEFKQRREQSIEFARPPGGETPIEVKERVSSVLPEIIKKAESSGINRLVIVTHDSVATLIKMILCKQEGWENFTKREFTNASALILKGNWADGFEEDFWVHKPMAHKDENARGVIPAPLGMESEDLSALFDAALNLNAGKYRP